MAVRGGSDLDIQDEEELLLIVSGIGEHVVAEGRYMIGTDCKDCVSDLQRYLRRDDPMVMAAHRALDLGGRCRRTSYPYSPPLATPTPS